MSVCTFLASNSPLPPFAPSQDYPLEINIDTGIIYDGNADDNYFLHPFEDVSSYTPKKYGVWLEWHCTDGRAQQILHYIKDALQNTESVELWHVWLMDYYEYDERPFIHKRTIPISQLTIDDIKKLDNAENWNKPDKYNPDRPSFYCLTITH